MNSSIHFCVRVDLTVYSMKVVKRAVYDLSAAWCVTVSVVENSTVKMDFVSVSSATISDEKAARIKLSRLLCEHDLRETLEKSTAPIRNLLLAQAFLPISLAYPELDSKNWLDAISPETSPS